MNHSHLLGKVLVISFLVASATWLEPAAAETTSGLVSEDPWSQIFWQYPAKAGESLTDFEYGDPTAAEQGHLEEINRARMDPMGEAAMFGFDLFEGVPTGAISGSPVQPLTFNAMLYETALLHSADMLARQFFAHVNPDGISPGQRITAQGYRFRIAGENLAVRGSTAPLDEYDTVIILHEDLFVDEGITDRGHRVNILNEEFKEVGIGVRFGPFDFGDGPLPNSWMLTANFGASLVDNRSFILGVVIDDANADGFYSEGEGIGGVEIAVIGAGERTVTASAGGYGIPVPAGTYTVEARHPDGRTAARQVTIGDQNIKIDFMLAELSSMGSIPAATIMANGQAGSVAVASFENVEIRLGMETAGLDGTPSDWWLVQLSGNDLLSFDIGAFAFLAGPLTPTLRETPLFGFAPVPILSVQLSPGSHLFCFGVDLDGNGVLDVDTLHFDCVNITASDG